MKIAARLFEAWFDGQRLSHRCRAVAEELGFVLRSSIRLIPTISGGGADRVFLGRTTSGPHRDLACIRMACTWRQLKADENGLPRTVLPHSQRIARESVMYARLSSLNVTPHLIARSTDYLANTFIPWERASRILRHDEQQIWKVLPAVLEAVTTMHEAGCSHMDLNTGNILVSPCRRIVRLIDFEYAPVPGMAFRDQVRFDLLRLAHNLLKPRRGRTEILAHPYKFLRMFTACAPEASEKSELLKPDSFGRIFDHPVIASELCEAFGIMHWSQSRSFR